MAACEHSQVWSQVWAHPGVTGWLLPFPALSLSLQSLVDRAVLWPGTSALWGEVCGMATQLTLAVWKCCRQLGFITQTGFPSLLLRDCPRLPLCFLFHHNWPDPAGFLLCF